MKLKSNMLNILGTVSIILGAGLTVLDKILEDEKMDVKIDEKVQEHFDQITKEESE